VSGDTTSHAPYGMKDERTQEAVELLKLYPDLRTEPPRVESAAEAEGSSRWARGASPGGHIGTRRADAFARSPEGAWASV
jgi:hypothetical protein